MLPLHFHLSLALLIAGAGFLHFRNLFLRKLGMICLWVASGGILWGLTGRWWLGLVALVAWVALPISEMFYVLHRLRLPRHRVLNSALAPIDDFPELKEITSKLEALEFRKVDDCKLLPSVHDQFYRLFVHPSEPIHAFVGMISQGAFGFVFVAFSSEDRSGDQWVTWDYPLSYGLVMPPELFLFRHVTGEGPADLLEAHRQFLAINQIRNMDLIPMPNAASVRANLEKTMSTQLEYNWSIGILATDRGEPESFRYSWRGFIYVVAQVLRDFVRM